MNKDIILEAEFFLSSFFWGIILLFLYDCIRIFRRIKHHIWMAVAIEDCLFWGIAGIFIFHMVYERNYGIIRAFAAGGMVLGMWLYLKLISRWYVSTFVKLIHKAERGIARFVVFITKPLRFIYTNIDKRLNKISLFLRKKINKFIEKQKKLLKSAYEHYRIERDAKKALKLKKKQEELIKKQINNKKNTKKYIAENSMQDHIETSTRKMGVLEKIERETNC